MDMLIIFVFGTIIAKWKVLSLFLKKYLAAWLAAASLQDKTASPTDNRMPPLFISIKSLVHKIQIPWDLYA